jgi:protein-S-isoprenylcysteine O-methyltransferase Ste14
MSLFMTKPPQPKALQTASFVVHATRGVIRAQKTRRKAMLVILLAALLLLISGVTFLQTIFNPREHPGWFILFWAVCAWLTLTAILLAVFDLLMVRTEARRVQRALRGEMTPDSPGSTTNL